MARQKFRMVYGMKENPETHVLLYPGDIFEIESDLIMKPPEFGGWLQRDRDPSITKPDERVNWVLVCAVRVPDSTPEELTMRAEPSQLIGINVSEREFLGLEALRAQKEGAIHPDVAESLAGRGVAGVRRREAPPRR